MFRSLLFSLAVIIVCITPLSVPAQSGKAETAISEIMQQHQVVGLAVAVVKNGKISYTHSFGLKNAETNMPIFQATKCKRNRL